MVKRTLPTNPRTRHTIKVLRKASSTNNADIWRALSDSLCAPTRNSTSVNLSKIDMLTNEGEVVAIPGKVLGFGSLTKKVDVAAPPSANLRGQDRTGRRKSVTSRRWSASTRGAKAGRY